MIDKVLQQLSIPRIYPYQLEVVSFDEELDATLIIDGPELGDREYGSVTIKATSDIGCDFQ